MSPERRKKAKFYARLAAAPPVNMLRPKQRDKLVRETKQIVFPLESFSGSTEHRAYVDREIVAGLQKAQSWLSDALRRLIVGESVCIPRRAPTVHLDRLNPMEDGMVALLEITKAEDRILRDAIRFLHASVLPYKMCEQCQTIFVSDDLRIKFCSAECRKKSQSSAVNPARREYLRQWAAKRRGELRKQQVVRQAPRTAA
jgi:hypothetical protein